MNRPSACSCSCFTTPSSFFGTTRNVPERSIRIARYNKISPTNVAFLAAEEFNAGRLAKNIMANGFPYAMYSFEAELVYSGLLPGTNGQRYVGNILTDQNRIIYYRELQQKMPLY